MTDRPPVQNMTDAELAFYLRLEHSVLTCMFAFAPVSKLHIEAGERIVELLTEQSKRHYARLAERADCAVMGEGGINVTNMSDREILNVIRGKRQ